MGRSGEAAAPFLQVGLFASLASLQLQAALLEAAAT